MKIQEYKRFVISTYINNFMECLDEYMGTWGHDLSLLIFPREYAAKLGLVLCYLIQQ